MKNPAVGMLTFDYTLSLWVCILQGNMIKGIMFVGCRYTVGRASPKCGHGGGRQLGGLDWHFTLTQLQKLSLVASMRPRLWKSREELRYLASYKWKLRDFGWLPVPVLGSSRWWWWEEQGSREVAGK